MQFEIILCDNQNNIMPQMIILLDIVLLKPGTFVSNNLRLLVHK